MEACIRVTGEEGEPDREDRTRSEGLEQSV